MPSLAIYLAFLNLLSTNSWVLWAIFLFPGTIGGVRSWYLLGLGRLELWELVILVGEGGFWCEIKYKSKLSYYANLKFLRKIV